MAGSITEVTDTNFQAEVIESDQPVLVDFWAPWCGPCRVVGPVLEEIASERDDLRIVKLNVDDNQQTAANFEVLSIPTLILFKNGQVAKKVIGAYPKKRLEAELEPALRLADPLSRLRFGPLGEHQLTGREPQLRVRPPAGERHSLPPQPAAHPVGIAQRRRRDRPVGLEHPVRALRRQPREPLVDAQRLARLAARRGAHVAVAHPASRRDRVDHGAQLLGIHLVLLEVGVVRRP